MSRTLRFALPVIAALSLSTLLSCDGEGADPILIGILTADTDSDGILDDGSGDGVINSFRCAGGNRLACDDNCLVISNSTQADNDNDSRGNQCDNCPDAANVTQTDGDGDGIGDVCDIVDSDLDGILNDFDLDGVFEPCVGGDTTECDDNCPDLANPLQTDDDSDGVGDACDNCLEVANSDQDNADGDARGDACETCDNDANKFEPGACGCGQSDNSTDGDTVPPCDDNCPNHANQDQDDDDGDDVGDVCDNCPDDANANQANTDGDAAGDECDGCPNDPDRTIADDADGDGILGCVDNCAAISNADQANSDGDAFGNVCDNCPNFASDNGTDADGDGNGDICERFATFVITADFGAQVSLQGFQLFVQDASDNGLRFFCATQTGTNLPPPSGGGGAGCDMGLPDSTDDATFNATFLCASDNYTFTTVQLARFAYEFRQGDVVPSCNNLVIPGPGTEFIKTDNNTANPNLSCTLEGITSGAPCTNP